MGSRARAGAASSARVRPWTDRWHRRSPDRGRGAHVPASVRGWAVPRWPRRAGGRARHRRQARLSDIRRADRGVCHPYVAEVASRPAPPDTSGERLRWLQPSVDRGRDAKSARFVGGARVAAAAPRRRPLPRGRRTGLRHLRGGAAEMLVAPPPRPGRAPGGGRPSSLSAELATPDECALHAERADHGRRRRPGRVPSVHRARASARRSGPGPGCGGGRPRWANRQCLAVRRGAGGLGPTTGLRPGQGGADRAWRRASGSGLQAHPPRDRNRRLLQLADRGGDCAVHPKLHRWRVRCRPGYATRPRV